MPAATVLIIEDADAIRLGVEVALRGQGYEVASLRDGGDLEGQLRRLAPQLVVLDINLPGRDGWTLLPLIRDHGDTAVIMLTARDTPTDRVRGLRGGADDYVVKPFVMAELLARVEAVLRRWGPHGATVRVDDLIIDRDGSDVQRSGVRIELTETERRLLEELARRPGRIVAKSQLLTTVWGFDGFDDNLVEVHISALRRKLESHGSRLIHTVRGRGYRLGGPP